MIHRQVVETNHTLILGWSEKGLAVLQQIALANKSAGGLPIVVLCGESKEAMEDIVGSASQRKEDRLELHGSRVVFRTGNPINEHDLVRPICKQSSALLDHACKSNWPAMWKIAAHTAAFAGPSMPLKFCLISRK
jgi:ion channel POLLUX/CASTOR